MKITEQYFENIFFLVKNLWKKQYLLQYGNNSKSFISSIGEDFDEIQYNTEVENKALYNEWHSMMVLVTYQVLTEIGLKLLEQGIHTLNIDDIPIETFEKKYKENLEYEGNDEYLKKYKGLKTKYSEQTSEK